MMYNNPKYNTNAIFKPAETDDEDLNDIEEDEDEEEKEQATGERKAPESPVRNLALKHQKGLAEMYDVVYGTISIIADVQKEIVSTVKDPVEKEEKLRRLLSNAMRLNNMLIKIVDAETKIQKILEENPEPEIELTPEEDREALLTYVEKVLTLNGITHQNPIKLPSDF